MPDIKLSFDDKGVFSPSDSEDLPDGYTVIHSETAKTEREKSFTKRLGAAKASQRSSLLDDEEFASEVAKKHGFVKKSEKSESNNSSTSDDEVAKLRREFTEQINSLKTENKKVKSENSRKEFESTLKSQLVKAEIKSEVLDMVLRDSVTTDWEWDENQSSYVSKIKDEHGIPLDMDEYVSHRRKSDKNFVLFQDKRSRSTKPGNIPNGVSTGKNGKGGIDLSLPDNFKDMNAQEKFEYFQEQNSKT